MEELVEFIIKCLAEKFIPSKLTIILNEGIMINKIKVLTYKNMKLVESDLTIDSLKPYENFFRKYSGTTSYSLFEYEIKNPALIAPFEKIHPEIIVPVLGLSGMYGIILFGPKMLEEEYSKQEIGYIDRLMKFTSIGIQNNIHYEHSVKDSKTGLYNHNFFIHRVHEELSRSKRTKNSFSLIVMDIDKFKHFNDTYGHLAGDEVIIEISKALKLSLREGDILSRFGGEEFTVLLPDSESEEAWKTAERIRKTIDELIIIYHETELHVTISLGISIYHWVEELDENTLVKRADEALYESKKNGRNQTTIYKSGLLHRAQQISED